MARGVTLGELVTKLRIAARYDPNPALSLNVVDLMKQTIRDTQERLYDEFDWPFLRGRYDKTLSAGQLLYDVPTELNLERIVAVDVQYGGQWLPVERGITLAHYNQHDSDDTTVRRDPVQRWEVMDTAGTEQIEVWPRPNSDGDLLRFTGFRKLRALTANADIADIDDQLIVLFAAGELLGGAKNPEAQLKIAQGNKRLEKLQGRVTKRRSTSFQLGGSGGETDPVPRRTIAVTAVQS